MHKLSASFILGYHGCDESVGEGLLRGEDFQSSKNDYDWLGGGVYFWEANPLRGLEFAREVSQREPKRLKKPFVVGAILDLGHCLDLTTSAGLQMVKQTHQSLSSSFKKIDKPMPVNKPEQFRHSLDCAVINFLHQIRSDQKQPAIDSVKGIFRNARSYMKAPHSWKRITFK